ncbi:MAG TPA: bifunctional hydroxymethylpyrimidine kinase/phosphomethylpyrimidine kinase [Hyphomicrobiaceae bacterium]|jgi:hydroxymethylpyrimidine/phosphomethylpyrimidine kinase|nr:bifunctional hydroxymethylpyrimidine kinase/phosphomethylpyrimidine kinase [Hyphomicrobiaceae bacterium]
MSGAAPEARTEPRTAIALTIAGSDSSGGAGIQADLKTFSAFGVYGASVITALTAQNTRGVQGIHAVPPDFVAAQIEAVVSDLDVGAVKTGMLADAGIVVTVARALAAAPPMPLIVDPVMVATSGDRLLAQEAVASLKRDLVPLATLVTPNLAEAAILLGTAEAGSAPEMLDQAKALLALGCRAVLLKGGHAHGEAAVDILADAKSSERLELARLDTPHTHGTGCTLSAAVAALLARGAPLGEAVRRAKAYVWRGLRHGRTLGVGHGRGPLDHLYAIRTAPPPA